MIHPLRIKKFKLELAITFLLFFYYLGFNVPEVVTKAWALFGFLTIPLLIIWNCKRFAWVIFKDIPMLLLIVTVPISVLWSVNQDATLAYSRAFLCSTAFGIFLATCYTPKEQMQLLFWILGIFICLNFTFGIQSGTEPWVGVTRYKNELSGSMSMAGTFFLTIYIYSFSKYRWIKLGLTGLSLLMLILSQGKGSLAIFVGLLPLLPLHKLVKQKYRLRTILLILALAIIVAITVVIIVNLEFIVVDILGKDMGGNARDQVWTYLIERGLEKPWLGYGYAGFWNDPKEGLNAAREFPWIIGAGEGGGNAHSNYIETFLHLGWLGIILIGISFLTVLTRVVLLHYLTRQVEYFWMIQFLLILAFTSFYDSYGGFLAYRHWFWVLYVSYAFSTAVHLNRVIRFNNKLINIKVEKKIS